MKTSTFNIVCLDWLKFSICFRTHQLRSRSVTYISTYKLITADHSPVRLATYRLDNGVVAIVWLNPLRSYGTKAE